MSICPTWRDRAFETGCLRLDLIDSGDATVIQESTKPAAVVSPQRTSGEYRLKSELHGRLVPVKKQARDEEESEARGDTETTREAAPSSRKRRASDSFDLQESGILFDDETELVRVSTVQTETCIA